MEKNVVRAVTLLVFGGFLLSSCGTQEPASPMPSVTPVANATRAEATASPTLTTLATHTPTLAPSETPTPARTATPFIIAPAVGETVSIPILMYHHLKFREPNASQSLLTWSVAPDQFAAQLDMLQERGFHTITFKQLVEFFDQEAPLPVKPILLTFDDGWIDGYTVAFPELKKRGMVGNFFVPTRYANAGGELLMNWDQIMEMDRAGMEFGGHTVNHADLTKVNLSEVRRELRVSKALMEEKLGHPTYALSYPFGAFNPKVVSEAQAAGYRAALILCCGYQLRSDTMLALPRIRISYGDSLDKVAGELP